VRHEEDEVSSDSTPIYLNTTQVSKALGVSVSTVKRWVDDGVLPAHKTAGGHRKLLLADVLELARRSDLPHADLSHLIDTSVHPPRKPKGDSVEGLYKALLGGDLVQVRILILGAFRRGIAMETLADQIIRPAMAKIGRDWQLGKIDVMEEHRATQICAGTLYELKALLEERAEKKLPRAVGGAPEKDHSILPTLLAQMVLIAGGWDAVNIGPNTPFSSFIKAIDDLEPRLVWLSVGHLESEDEFLTGYRELYRHAEKSGVAVAIGGRAMVEALRSKIPYTTYGDGLEHLAAFARTLHPRAKPPRRGRPRRS
jgi:excisionase family DNA binding protein